MDILKNLDLSLIVGGGYLIFVKYGDDSAVSVPSVSL